MNYVLLHTPTWSPDPLRALLPDPRIEVRAIAEAGELIEEDRPTVFVLDHESRAAFPVDILRGFVDAGGAIVALAAPDEIDVPDTLPGELLSGFLRHPAGARQVLVSVRAGYREAAARMETARARAEAALRSRETQELTRIGVALGAERDLNTLLGQILTQARHITQSDAGSIYLVVKPPEVRREGSVLTPPAEVAATAGGRVTEVVAAPDEPGIGRDRRRLRFTLAQNHSKPDVPLRDHFLPMDRSSLAGYAATTGEPLVIDDAYFLPPDVEYKINRSFDERYGYRTKSMLVIPMKDHAEEVIGVVQLINRKRNFDAMLETPADVEREVVPYSRRTVELGTALAAQAGVAIENSALIKEIEDLFATFVDAAVFTIEQRDPITQGHSRRVASMTVALAEVVNRVPNGVYGKLVFTDQQIREIQYAALLHDFGKVGVRETVLQKAKKLPELHLDLLRERHAFVRRTFERTFWQRRAEYLEQHGTEGFAAFLAELEAAHAVELAEIDRYLEVVVGANEPTVLQTDIAADIATFATRSYESLSGEMLTLLDPREVRYLSIRKGSLDDDERLEIETHVTHTYNFLSMIPWPKHLGQVPNIAFGHHEKLDGRGYPRKIRGEEIPIPTRMMTISDIYDALTAKNRPYKPKLPLEKALDIIHDEVKSGQLDADLYSLFVEGKVFEKGDIDSA